PAHGSPLAIDQRGYQRQESHYCGNCNWARRMPGNQRGVLAEFGDRLPLTSRPPPPAKGPSRAMMAQRDAGAGYISNNGSCHSESSIESCRPRCHFPTPLTVSSISLSFFKSVTIFSVRTISPSLSGLKVIVTKWTALESLSKLAASKMPSPPF